MYLQNDYTEKKLKSQDKKMNLEKQNLSKATEKKIIHEVFYSFMSNLADLKEISMSKLQKVNDCAMLLKFITNESRSVFSLVGGSFCNDRMCPVCSWRKARKTAVVLLELMEYARVKMNKEFIFLTLTAPNVHAEELSSEIDSYNQSFKRLSENKAFKKISLGYIRKLEITYNSKENTYHPHFHIIIAVNKSYFKKSDYLSRADWLAMWQKAKRDPNITQVDVRKIQMKSIKEVFEIATYATKQKQLYSDLEIFKVFRNAFKNRRILVYNGLFRDLKKLRDDGLLVVDDLENLNGLKESADREIYYKWCADMKQYNEFIENELSEDDFKKIYNIDFNGLDED